MSLGMTDRSTEASKAPQHAVSPVRLSRGWLLCEHGHSRKNTGSGTTQT